MLLSAICCFFLFFGNSESAMIGWQCLFCGTSIAAWNALDVLTVELYPTTQRSVSTWPPRGSGPSMPACHSLPWGPVFPMSQKPEPGPDPALVSTAGRESALWGEQRSGPVANEEVPWCRGRASGLVPTMCWRPQTWHSCGRAERNRNRKQCWILNASISQVVVRIHAKPQVPKHARVC